MKRFLTQIGKLFTAESDDLPKAPEPDAASRLEATLAARRRSALIAQQKAAESEPAEDSIPFVGNSEPEEGSFGTRVEDMGPGKTVLRTSYLIDPAGRDESLS